jgi:hypothetical protein
MVRLFAALPLLLACGCVPLQVFQRDETAMVQSSHFTTPAQLPGATTSAKLAPASPEASLTVERVGQKLLAGNKQLGIKPAFKTIGGPDPEIGHMDTSVVYITESLVRQCKSENQLAAVLSLEIGKMISERETLINPEYRNPPKRLPIEVPMGNAGQFSGMTQLHDSELAKLDADRRFPPKRVVAPDPQVLAHKYLEAAGFDSKELDPTPTVPQAAEKNYTVEQPVTRANAVPIWVPK